MFFLLLIQGQTSLLALRSAISKFKFFLNIYLKVADLMTVSSGVGFSPGIE
jgi:hypothetical protein